MQYSDNGSYSNIVTTSPQADTDTGGISSKGTALNHPGGVIEYQVGSPSAPLGSVSSPTSAHVGDILTIGAGGMSRSGGTMEVTTADLNGGHTGLLATARNNGSPAMGVLTADTVVTYQGLEMSLASLEAMGVVEKTANGSYQERTANTQQGDSNDDDADDDQKSELPEGIELFSAEVETQVAQAIESVPQPIYDAAIASYIESGFDAESIQWNDLAYHSGLTPEQARANAEVVRSAFEAQAVNLVKAQGANPEEVFTWIQSERPAQFKAAVRELAFGRSVAGINNLIADFHASVAPRTESLAKYGFQVSKDIHGNDLFNLNGQWVSPEVAALAGLIKRGA